MEFIYRYDPYQPVVVKSPANAQEALATLLAGNDRFVQFVAEMQAATLGNPASQKAVVPIDLVSMGLPLIPGVALDQRPFALVLGCADARVPVEGVFDQSFNDLFVIRIAGNVVGTECLGSFDYALRQFRESLKLVVVMGHSGCGAVTGAVDAYLKPVTYPDIAFTYPLRSLLDRIMIAVRIAAQGFERCGGTSVRELPGYRAGLIESAVFMNAAVTGLDLRREARPICGDAVEMMYGVCDLLTLRVRGAPHELPPGEKPRAKGEVGEATRVIRAYQAQQGILSVAPRQPSDLQELADRFATNIIARGVLN